MRIRLQLLHLLARRMGSCLQVILTRCRSLLGPNAGEGINNKIKINVIKRTAYGSRDDVYSSLKRWATFAGHG